LAFPASQIITLLATNAAARFGALLTEWNCAVGISNFFFAFLIRDILSVILGQIQLEISEVLLSLGEILTLTWSYYYILRLYNVINRLLCRKAVEVLILYSVLNVLCLALHRVFIIFAFTRRKGHIAQARNHYAKHYYHQNAKDFPYFGLALQVYIVDFWFLFI